MPDRAKELEFYLARQSMGRRFWLIFRRSLVRCYEDNVLGTAKGAAYSALLALFPMLTAVTAILVQANAVAVSESLARLVFEVVPPGTQEIIQYNFTQRGQRPVYLLITATLLAAWAASGVMMSLMQGFQAAYRITQNRSFWKHRGVALALVFATAIPVVLASALIVVGTRAEQWLFHALGLSEGEPLRGWVSLAAMAGRYVIAIISIAFGTSCLYLFGPNRRTSWRTVWRGAVIATVLYGLATMAFAWYVRNIASYNVLYGSIGAVVALTVWLYLLSIIALLGCEYNAERERLAAARLLP